MLKLIEYVEQRCTARARWRRGIDRVAAITADERRSLFGPVSGKILHRDQPAMRLHVGDNATCDFPLVEAVSAIFRDFPKRPGKGGALHHLVLGIERAIRLVEGGLSGFAFREPFLAPAEDERLVRGELYPVPRERDRGSDELCPGKLAPFPVQIGRAS